jgi:hypothetical protein
VQRIYSTLAPTASDKPELLADKRRGLLAYIAQAKVRAGPANLKAQEALDSLAKQSGLIYGDMPEETDVQRTLSTDGDTAAREIPPEMQKELRSFLGQVSPGKLDINSFSTFYSALAKKHGLDGTWDPAQGEAFVKSFNSGQPTLDIPPAVEGKTPLEQIGAGTGPVGTGVKNFASAMTLGLPEALAGEEGRIASQLADEANPKSALAGEVVGSIAPALAAEQAIAKALGKLGIKPGTRAYRVGADVLANMTTAGVTEYGQTGDSDKARTAAQWGAGGSLVGRGVAKGVAEFKPKEFREGLAALGPQDIIDDAGKKAGTIPATDLTTLQRMGSTGGEEFIEGFPTVAGTRQASVADFNRHNASRALAKAGLALPKDIQPGQAPNAYMHKTLGDEYDKLAPSIKGKVDVDFTNQVAAIRAKTMTAPRRGAKVDPVKAEAWQQIDDAFANFTQGGKFDYDSYKKFSTQLREWQDFWAKSTVGPNEAPSPVLNDMARTADKVRMAARELVSRVNPTAGARLKRLDSAWAHKLRIEEASKGASAQEKGVYAPQELLSATQRLDTSKAKGRFARGEAFDQPYAQSAMEVVGHKPAKGGSVLGTAAIGFGSGGTIVPVALAAYAPGIKRLTQLLTDGRLGKRLDRLTPNTVVAKYPELKELPSDVLKQVIASYIREKPTSGE